jgi:hypothetical protein
VKHRTIFFDELQNLLEGLGSDERLLMLKCEPAIVHVLCDNIDSANKLHQLAFSCGYRESGIGIGRKIMVAIRTTAFSLEVPISLEKRHLLTNEGLEVLVHECNLRLVKNFSRIQRFLDELKRSQSWPTIAPSLWTSNINFSQVVQERNGNLSLEIAASNLKDICTKGIRHFALLNWKQTIDSIKLDFFIISGGRKSLESPLPCLLYLAIVSQTSSIADPLEFIQSGDVPCDRWGHSLTQFDSRRMLITGGRNRHQAFNDAFFLEIDPSLSERAIHFIWTRIAPLPEPLFFHASCYLGETHGVLISGGLSQENMNGMEMDNHSCSTLVLAKLQTHIRPSSGRNILAEDLDEPTGDLLTKLAWLPIQGSQNTYSRFGHSITSIGAQTMLVLGGSSLDPLCPESNNSVEIWDLDYEQQLTPPSNFVTISIRQLSLPLADWRLGFGTRSHHHTLWVAGRLVVFGGSLQCGGLLGPCESPALEMNLQSFDSSMTPLISVNGLETPLFAPSHPSILAPLHITKSVKTYLESQKWFDKARRINNPSEEDLTTVVEVQLVNGIIRSDVRDLSTDATVAESWKALPINFELVELLKRDANVVEDLTQILSESSSPHSESKKSISLYLFDQQHRSPSKAVTVSGHSKATQYLKQLIPRLVQLSPSSQSDDLESQLQRDIPTKFEFVGTVIMIPETSLLREEWGLLSSFTVVYQTLLDIFNEPSTLKGLGEKYNRVARKAQIDPGPMRESRVQILHSLLRLSAQSQSPPQQGLSESPGWVTLVENKILYGFDITKVMYDSPSLPMLSCLTSLLGSVQEMSLSECVWRNS